MPKIKSHKGLRKRVKVTAGGKLKHRRPCAGHLLSGKSGARRQRLRRPAILHPMLAAKARHVIRA